MCQPQIISRQCYLYREEEGGNLRRNTCWICAYLLVYKPREIDREYIDYQLELGKYIQRAEFSPSAYGPFTETDVTSLYRRHPNHLAYWSIVDGLDTTSVNILSSSFFLWELTGQKIIFCPPLLFPAGQYFRLWHLSAQAPRCIPRPSFPWREDPAGTEHD